METDKEPRKQEKTRQQYNVPSLADLCVKAILSRCSTGKMSVLQVLELEQNMCLGTKLLPGLQKLVIQGYPAFREKHSSDALCTVLGREQWDRLEQTVIELEHSKRQMAALRSGQALSKTVLDSEDLIKDAQGNYPIKALLSGAKWPADVDPARREMSLQDDAFETLFKMSKEQFAKLPAFKRTRMKKLANLF